MFDIKDDIPAGYEFMRPLVSGWLAKIEGALTSGARKKWKEVSEECLMFYSRSAAAMWDPVYTKKFWRGVKSPKFRVTINKAFEFVAIFLPNLMWDVPTRKVTPKKILELPQQAFPDPQMYQAILQQAQMEHGQDRLVSSLLEMWLNYTPKEMPGRGLEGHNELALLDAMIKGQGILKPEIYSFPGSQRTLTGCFHKSPDDLLFDPDFNSEHKCKWMALRHREPHWVVERKFNLPTNSLKDRAGLESSWHYAETMSRENDGQWAGERKSGKTNDLVVWYEVWSKLGVGARMTGMPDSIKGQLEDVVGDYAYLAICPDCPYPLNCPTSVLQQGATSEEVRRLFEWPVPLWTDDRWPVERLVLYEDPESPYGLPPLSPALGELKAINSIVSWLVNRTWQTSRQMWAVLGQYHDDMKKVLDDGDDLNVFAIPPGAEDIRKVIQLIECNEVNKDAWQVLEMLSDLFDKRMGMTPFVYGQNEGGTQDRTAETTSARKSAVSARPEYMQKKVVGWQSRVAGVEAMLTWLFIKSSDVQPLLGNVGAQLWAAKIENADPELVMRQMSYEVAASSVRRPNRERDIENLQEVLARWLPVMQVYGEASGDFSPVNGTIRKWAELHDMQDVDDLMIPAKDPNSPENQLAQAQQQAEVQKTQAEAQKLTAEAQQNPALLKAQELQMKGQIDQQKLAMDMQKTEAELQAEMMRLKMELAMKQAELQMKAQEHQQEMQFKKEEGQVDLAVKTATGAQQIQQGQQQLAIQREQGATQIALAKTQGKAKLEQTKEQSKAKTQAIKQQGKAKASLKPKPKAA